MLPPRGRPCRPRVLPSQWPGQGAYDDNKRCTAVEEIDRYFGFASLMLLLIVGATWPLIVLIAVLTALCCHCRHRKNRINYNPIATITAEERKERAKQYMAQFNPSQALPVVEAPVAKMV